MIEMMNAFNALSDEGSIFTVGPFCNMFLVYAVIGSVSLHSMICYVPFFEGIFGTVPLSRNDWILVLSFTTPVVIVGEILKVMARARTSKQLAAREAERKK